MVRILLVAFLALLAPLHAHALNVGQGYIMACGAQVPIPAGKMPKDVIYLAGYATSGRYATFRSVNGSSGYQVTTGKTLHIFASCNDPASSGSASAWGLMYGDNNVGFDSVSAPTNQVNNFGYITNYMFNASGYVTGASSHVSSTDFQVPSTKYPAFQISASAAILAWGYEE